MKPCKDSVDRAANAMLRCASENYRASYRAMAEAALEAAMEGAPKRFMAGDPATGVVAMRSFGLVRLEE